MIVLVGAGHINATPRREGILAALRKQDVPYMAFYPYTLDAQEGSNVFLQAVQSLKPHSNQKEAVWR